MTRSLPAAGRRPRPGRYDIGTATIGNIVGNNTNNALIAARANPKATATTDLALGRLTVRGRVEYGLIIAGLDPYGPYQNADAQIGKVTVGGDWIASSIVAGAAPGFTGYYGNRNTGEFKMSGPNCKDVAGISSRIGGVTTAGQATGTSDGNDFFGIVAENVGTVKVGGHLYATNAGNGNDDFAIGASGDFKVCEV